MNIEIHEVSVGAIYNLPIGVGPCGGGGGGTNPGIGSMLGGGEPGSVGSAFGGTSPDGLSAMGFSMTAPSRGSDFGSKVGETMRDMVVDHAKGSFGPGPGRP